MITRTKTETEIASVFSPFKGGRSLQRKSWINRKSKLVGVALAAGMALGLAGTASAAIILYQENFDGDDVTLNNSTPSIFTHDDGAHGVPSSPSWSSSAWQQDGTITGSSGTNNAFLPFEPENGWIYTLTATLHNNTSGSAQFPWVALGFTEFSSTTNSFAGAVTVVASPWMIYRGEDANANANVVVSFVGPSSAGGQDHGTHASPVTLSVALDTTGDDWIAEWFLNGDSVRTHTYDGNPSINHVGFGRSDTAMGPIDSFQLTAVPEPGALALLGLGVGMILLRRRRS